MSWIYTKPYGSASINDASPSTSTVYSSTKTEALIDEKADKVSSPTTGNFAWLDGSWNLTDSWAKPWDYASNSHTHSAAIIPIDTTNFWGVLDTSVTNIQVLADFIDDNIALWANILFWTVTPTTEWQDWDVYINTTNRKVYSKESIWNLEWIIGWIKWDPWDPWAPWNDWDDWDPWLIWEQAYNAGTTYEVNDWVSYNGSSYICILESTWNVPTNVTYWGTLAVKWNDWDWSWDVVWPWSAVDDNIATFNSITGKLIQDWWNTIAEVLNTDNHIDWSTNRLYTTTEKGKLSWIEAWAETNNISDADATDLTDAWDTTLHYHSTDRARANHTGTQLASTVSNFDSAALSAAPAETTTTMWTLINWADAKTTPVDTDLVPIRDVTGWLLEKVTWANIKATLKTYFDSLTTTLTNKRITARVNTITSSATPTPVWDTTDEFTVTALAAAATFAAPTGTPTEGQVLLVRIKDDWTARTLAWNAIYRASSDLALPTTTILSKTLYLQFVYNNTDSKWDLLWLLDNF